MLNRLRVAFEGSASACTLSSERMHAGSPKDAIARWEAAWCDAILEALASPAPRLAANVDHFGLSVPLAMECGSLVTLLRRILAPASAAEQNHGSYSDGQVCPALCGPCSWHGKETQTTR